MNELGAEAKARHPLKRRAVGCYQNAGQSADSGGPRGRDRRPGIGEGPLRVVRDDQRSVSRDHQRGEIEILFDPSRKSAEI